jgi:hypothetical protein
MSHQPDNISAGTQVVSLVEVRGTSDSLVHPRGAVGVVTRTSASEGEHRFLVRFPDGFEGSLTRGQFDVLKHFSGKTFNGYAMSQFKKIEQDMRNHGEVRWKHAMHLLRLLLTGAQTLREGRVPVRVEAHRDRLLAVKRGEIPWAHVDVWRKELHHDFERALAETKLPERPDHEAANEFLLGARHYQIKH